jgi:hypothetical protein
VTHVSLSLFSSRSRSRSSSHFSILRRIRAVDSALASVVRGPRRLAPSLLELHAKKSQSMSGSGRRDDGQMDGRGSGRGCGRGTAKAGLAPRRCRAVRVSTPSSPAPASSSATTTTTSSGGAARICVMTASLPVRVQAIHPLRVIVSSSRALRFFSRAQTRRERGRRPDMRHRRLSMSRAGALHTASLPRAHASDGPTWRTLALRSPLSAVPILARRSATCRAPDEAAFHSHHHLRARCRPIPLPRPGRVQMIRPAPMHAHEKRRVRPLHPGPRRAILCPLLLLPRSVVCPAERVLLRLPQMRRGFSRDRARGTLEAEID